MNGFILLIPLFLIRYGLLALLSKDALPRAAFFAPVIGNEKIAYWLYQLANVFFFIYLFFLKIQTGTSWFYTGLAVYCLGTLLCIAATVAFAKPAENGISRDGVYRFSRNPMYVAYFLIFLGCVLLTRSWALFVCLIIFQVSAHWIILAEERWCIQQFGEDYVAYTHRVRRYM